MSKKRVLFVDDQELNRDLVKAALQTIAKRAGKEPVEDVDLAASVEEAKTLLAQNQYDLIVTDFDMPNATGVNLIRHIRANVPEYTKPVIIFSGSLRGSIETAAGGKEALAALNVAFLDKPIGTPEIYNTVQSYLNAVGAAPTTDRKSVV